MGAGLLGLAMVVAGCEPTSETQAGVTRVIQPTNFTLGVEQDGQRLPVRGHQVTLRRRPFRLVFFFDQADRIDPILVHASPTPELLEAARAGQDVNALFPPDASFVEEFLNPDGVLFVGGSGYHNWGYHGQGRHRFDPNGVDPLGEKGFLCRRTVATIRGSGREVSLADWPHDTMYLVFVQAKSKAEAQDSTLREKQRDWLELRFVDEQVTSK